MALDAYLQEDKNFPKTRENCFISFEDDGYYWFLFEFFKDLANQTGQMIDLYNDAFFEDRNLDLLNQTIQRAKTEILNKPEAWEEFIGTIVHKGEGKAEKRFSVVHKKELEIILAKLEKAIIKAKARNLGLFFFGD